ncbi:unnamed protein product [Rhodiola kirilowii]
MSLQWGGAIEAAAKSKQDQLVDVQLVYQSVGLVIGVTDFVGSSLAEILPLSHTPGGRGGRWTGWDGLCLVLTRSKIMIGSFIRTLTPARKTGSIM